MSRTILEPDSSQPRRRPDITLSPECKETVNRIIDVELRADDRPSRTKSAILEMLGPSQNAGKPESGEIGGRSID